MSSGAGSAKVTLMHHRKIVSLALVVAGLAGAAGCGDDAPSREDFTAQANELCRVANAKIAALPEPSDVDGLKAYVQKMKSVTSDSVDRFAKLEAPAEMRGDAEAYVANGRRVVALADRLATATLTGDEATMKELQAEGDRLDADSDERAASMGLSDCANDA
jgi:hypothetical protein